MTTILQSPPPLNAAPLPAQDFGLNALGLISGYYRIAAEPAQLRHQLALTGRVAEADDLVRASQFLGLKSRVVRNARQSVSPPCRCRRSSASRTEATPCSRRGRARSGCG